MYSIEDKYRRFKGIFCLHHPFTFKNSFIFTMKFYEIEIVNNILDFKLSPCCECCVLNAVIFLLGDYQASGFYVLTFRNIGT